MTTVPPHHRHIRAALSRRLVADSADLPVSTMWRLERLGALSARTGVSALARKLPGGDPTSHLAVRTTERTVEALGRLKGLPMKVGQLLSYADTSLHASTRAALSVLQTSAQPIPFGDIRSAIRAHLGNRADELLATLEPTPVGVGSIGQVHRATLPDGAVVAVKVRFPGIERAVQCDFGPAAIGARVTTWLDGAAKRDVFVAEAKARILEECDYRNEATRQVELARRFAHHPTIWIPAVHADYCGDGVLTMDFVDGVHLDDYLHGAPSRDDIDRVGTALFDFYYGSLFQHGMYNCDPHPGNYLFCPDGRVAVVDHGCTRMFAPHFVGQLAALTRAVEADEREAIDRALVDMDILRRGQPYDRRVARDLLRWFYGPLLRDQDSSFRTPDVTVRKLVADKDLRSLAIPAEFLFLVRMRIGVAAVLARLGARTNWHAKQREYLTEADYQLATPVPFDEVTPTFDVVLVEAGDRLIELIRELRDLLGVSIRDARDLADGAPSVLRRGASRPLAEELAARLGAAGAAVDVRRV